MAVKETLTKALKAMRNEVDGFESLIEERYRTSSGNYDTWGPKDLYAHSAEWTRRLVLDLQDREPDDDFDGVGDLNRALFERHEDTPWNEIDTMLKDNLAVVADELEKRSEDQLVATDPESNNRPGWWGIAFYSTVHNLTHLGQALIRSENSKQAIELQERMTPLLLDVDDYAPWVGMIAYNLGRVYALTGDTERAVEEVRKAIECIPPAAEWAQNDEDFASIKDALEG